ncbi:MAG: extracellular solute-binding protein [Corallococcus sp.]|nr:extracellular solute-binding protein [Corallococcus sp.]MCM1359847.1 extracellular solute-binding protein [Corallococcus sp.]MCM1395281.1 extracellular solute-binding protein [Corallococcus sp.]
MRKFAKTALCLLLCLCCALSFIACDGDVTPTDKLVVYNWADYIYDYEDDFKQYYKAMTGNNVDITYVTFDTNETMLTKIMKGDSSVDVMCPSEYAIQKLLENDLLVELNYFDEEKYVDGLNLSADYKHNGDNVDGQIIEKVSEAFGSVQVGDKTVNMVDYFVPYMYGTLGILYNKYAFMDLGIYDKEVINKANWGILFNDDGSGNMLSKGLSGSILMKDSIRDSYAATVFYLLQSGKLDGLTYNDKSSPLYGTKYTDMPIGDLINAVDDQLIDLCKEALTNQKRHLFGYEVDFGKDDLLKGNAAVDLAWSGDAMYAVEESWSDELEDYELSYYVPNTAGNIWFDGWVIPKTHDPEHLRAIKLFINFLNSPYVAAQNMMEIGYSSAVDPEVVRTDAEARAVLSESYLVYDPEYWDNVDENGKPLTEETADYASWKDFEDYFFYDVNEIDDSNWRYPFVSAANNGAERDLATLGVMRDFGQNNKAVVTMWNYARSAGVSVWGVLGITLGVLALAAGVIALALLVKERAKSKVVTKTPSQS